MKNKQVLSLVLAIVMVVTQANMTALAAEIDETEVVEELTQEETTEELSFEESEEDIAAEETPMEEESDEEVTAEAEVVEDDASYFDVKVIRNITFKLNGGNIDSSENDVERTEIYFTDEDKTFYKVANSDATEATGTDYSKKISEVAATVTGITKTGYDFAGWYSAATDGTKLDDEALVTSLTENVTYYAHWTAKTAVVTYNPGVGGELVAGLSGVDESTKTKTYSYDAAFGALPSATSTGKVFKGWKIEGTADTALVKPTDVSQLTVDTTFVAVWQEHTYKVSFNKNASSATGSMATQTIKISDSATLSTNTFVRKYSNTENYTIKEWNTKADGTGISFAVDALANSVITDSVKPGDTIKLYAIWQGPARTITYDLDGGMTLSSDTGLTPVAQTEPAAHNDYTGTVHVDGKIGAMPIAVKSGETFRGWYANAGEGTLGTPITADTVVTENITVKPVFVGEVTPDAPSIDNLTLTGDNAATFDLADLQKIYLTAESGATIYYELSAKNGTIATKTSTAICVDTKKYTEAIDVASKFTGAGTYEIVAFTKKDGVACTAALDVTITVTDAAWGQVTSAAKTYALSATGLNITSPSQLPNAMWMYAPASVTSLTYNGLAQKKADEDLEVYYKNKKLVLNKDYTIAYKNNKNVTDEKHVGTITVKGKGSYAGTRVQEFTINPKDQSKIYSKPFVTNFNANGKVQKSKPIYISEDDTGKAVKLIEKKDYILSYPSQDSESAVAYKDKGTYIVKATFIGNYTGTKSFTETIVAANDISIADVDYTEYYYKEEAITSPTIKSVKLSGKTLRKDVDYTISEVFVDTNAGGAADKVDVLGDIGHVRLQGKAGKYIGYVDIPFKIAGKTNPDDLIIKLKNEVEYDPDPDVFFNSVNSSIEIRDKNSNTLLTQTNETNVNEIRNIAEPGYKFADLWSYASENVGNTFTAMILPTGYYGGGIKYFEFKLKNGYDLTKERPTSPTVISVDDQTYKNGQKVEPRVTVVIKSGTANALTLVEGRDYKVTYSNNTKISDSAKVKITGIGNYSGTVEKTFKITKSTSPITGVANDVAYSAKEGNYKTKVTISTDGKALKEGRDYNKIAGYKFADGCVYAMKDGKNLVYKTAAANTEVPAKAIVLAGTRLYVEPIMTDSAKELFTESKMQAKVYYRIVGADIAKASAKLSKTIEFDARGVVITEDDLEVKMGKTVLDSSEFEIVSSSFTDTGKAGTAKVTIRGLGNYGGSKVVSFKISAKSMNYNVTYDKGNLPTYDGGTKTFTNNTAKVTIKNTSTGIGSKLANCNWTIQDYEFRGWAASASETNASKISKTLTKELVGTNAYGSNITLYAIWQPRLYKVTYKNVAKGQTIENPNPTIFTKRVAQSLVPATKAGYQFKCWKIDGEVVTSIPADYKLNDPKTTSVVVEAVWENTKAATYKADKAELNVGGSALTVTTKTTAKAGYTAATHMVMIYKDDAPSYVFNTTTIESGVFDLTASLLTGKNNKPVKIYYIKTDDIEAITNIDALYNTAKCSILGVTELKIKQPCEAAYKIWTRDITVTRNANPDKKDKLTFMYTMTNSKEATLKAAKAYVKCGTTVAEFKPGTSGTVTISDKFKFNGGETVDIYFFKDASFSPEGKTDEQLAAASVYYHKTYTVPAE